MTKEEIKEYLNRVDKLLDKLKGEDKETLSWLIYGYNQCAKLLNKTQKENEKLKNQIAQLEKENYDIKYLHFHNVTEIGMCISGSGICCIEGNEQKYNAGDVQIIFPYMFT